MWLPQGVEIDCRQIQTSNWKEGIAVKIGYPRLVQPKDTRLLFLGKLAYDHECTQTSQNWMIY